MTFNYTFGDAGAQIVTVTYYDQLNGGRPLSRWKHDATRMEQADIVAAAQPPSVDPSRLLILCCARDEARRWLRMWDLAAEAPPASPLVMMTAP